MSYYSLEQACHLSVAESITKSDVKQWIHEFSKAALNNYLSSGKLPDHFDGSDLEISADHDQATALIAEEVWHYVRWCASNRAEDSFILIQCEDDSDAADADWFLQITQFFANKTANPLPSIRQIQQDQSKTTIKDLILLEKNGEVVLKTQQDVLQVLNANLDRFAAIL